MRAADVLELAPDLQLRLAGDDALVETPRGSVRAPTRALLDLLALFAKPVAVREALSRADAHGATEWAERFALTEDLVRTGALVGATNARRCNEAFADPSVHVRMLADEERVGTYLAALRAHVRPDDVVIDLGTGTGVLAVAAARAGARRVYAIEESGIAAVAEEVFRRNGVADRVTLLRGRSTEVEVEERATLLVTETLGNDPLGEGMLVFLEDARKRLLRPDARMIPAQLEIVVQLVEMAEERAPALDTDLIDAWKAQYHVDLGPLMERHRTAHTAFTMNAGTLSGAKRCSVPMVVEVIDLAASAATCEAEVEVTTTASAARAGAAIGFRAELAPGIALEVGPRGAATSHWSTPVRLPLVPRPVGVGQRLTIRYRRDRTSCSVSFD